MPETYRVIVIEDDPDVSQYTKTVIERRTQSVVRAISDPREVKKQVVEFEPDVIVTDIELSGASGLDLIAIAREVRPGIPVTVMTAFASVDYAVSAMRNQADEFLSKPVASADLVAHHAAGDSVTILTLSPGADISQIAEIWANASSSAAFVGAELLLEDALNGTPEESQLLVELIDGIVCRVRPTIACYEGGSPSADFRPNRFIPIDGFTDIQLAMMAPFTPENDVPTYLQPDLSLASAGPWSKFAEGSTYCEALEIVRDSARLV